MEAAASLREELENTASLEWKLQLLLENEIENTASLEWKLQLLLEKS